MASRNDWIELVGRLIEAENDGGTAGRRKADEILSGGFMTITRATGKEEERGELLDAIENPTRRVFRKLDRDRCRVWQCGGVSVVKSVVTMHELSDSEEILGTYRNIHVFYGNEAADGQCFAWQVTEVGKTTPG
jgi:hypothetical protein